MTTLLFSSAIDRGEWWREELVRRVPGLDVRIAPDIGAREDIEFALVWKPDPGLLRSLPNLRAIFSLGAGVDHIFADPELPAGVPITRVVDRDLTRRMTEYVVLHVLWHHRQQGAYEAQQARAEWRELHQPGPGDRTVGIMGMGELGSDAARALAGLGLDVVGWSRSPRPDAGIEVLHGTDGLDAFLGRCEILVCLLPLTPETENILNRELFARLPHGAVLINAARGRHLVEEDLIPALESGQLGAATLDVFREEPLPADHPFWRHPAIRITPHIASIADPRSVADQVAANIARARRGEPLVNVVDPARGY